MERRKFLFFSAATFAVSAYGAKELKPSGCGVTSWYIPRRLAKSPNNIKLFVRDTDSALGRYNKPQNTKTITLEDVVKFHGHLCDGVVFSYLQISAILKKLFPDGVIDRTDLQGACKNSPCMVDTLAYLTGARINFKTLKIDPTLGLSHIVQRISTGETYKAQLAPGTFHEELNKAEKSIRAKVANKEAVLPSEIDNVEKLADKFIYDLLHTPLEKLIVVEKIDGYKFEPNSDVSAFGGRGDVVNKNVARH